MRRLLKNTACISIILVALTLSAVRSHAKMNYYEEIKGLVNSTSAVFVTRCDGKYVLKINEGLKLVPASIFKIVTAAAAYHYLNEGYRFKTDFYIDDNDLYIKGYGDPLLISEELETIAARFKEKGVKRINNIYLDNSFFDAGIRIDGVEKSLNPYDATNGALCVNFNTISVTVNNKSVITSAEEQTPMTKFGKEMVNNRITAGMFKSGKTERIILSHEKGETLLYVGHLFKEFLRRKGIRVSGRIEKRTVTPKVMEHLFYSHSSSKDLNDIVKSMMKYSNNFTANQVFLVIGAAVYGEPATVKKGVDAIRSFLDKKYGIIDIKIAEGSGISRGNKISALDFMEIMCDYKTKHIDTLTENGGVTYKTGTLKDVKSASGFIEARNGDLYGFVIILNNELDFTKRGKILKAIKGMIYGED